MEISAGATRERATTTNQNRRAKSICQLIHIPKTTLQHNMTVQFGDKELRENYASTIQTNSDSFFQTRFRSSKGIYQKQLKIIRQSFDSRNSIEVPTTKNPNFVEEHIQTTFRAKTRAQSPEKDPFNLKQSLLEINQKSGLLHEIPLKKKKAQSFAGLDSSLLSKSQALQILQGQTNNDGAVQIPKRSLQLKTAKQIEEWFNEVVEPYVKLIDPDPLKTPLMKLKIDRLTLGKLGINTKQIERMYRSIYVSSVGFFQTLGDILKHQKNNGLICRIWKGYLYVLQAICMTDFEDANAEFMRLADSVAIEARLEMQNYKDSMMKDESAKETLLRDLKEENIELLQEKQQNKKVLQFNNIELSKTRGLLEEEITLRLEFEYKINQLVAANRHLRINEKTNMDRLAELERNNNELKALNMQYEKTNIDKDCLMRQINLEMTQTKREHSENLNELETFKQMHFELERKFLQNEERLGQRHNLWMKNMTEINVQNTLISGLNMQIDQLKTADLEMQEKVKYFQKKHEEQTLFIQKEIAERFTNQEELNKLKNQLFDQEFANELLQEAQFRSETLARKRDKLNKIIQEKDIVLKQLQDKIFELERRLDSANLELTKAKHTIKVCNKKIEDDKTTIDTITVVVEGIRQQLLQKQRELDMFNVTADNLRVEIRVQKQIASDFERGYDEKKVQNRVQQLRIDEQKAHLTELEKKIQEHLFVEKTFAINLKKEQTQKAEVIADRDLKSNYIQAQKMEILDFQVKLQMTFHQFATISVRFMMTTIKLAMTTKFIKVFVAYHCKEIEEREDQKQELTYKIEKQEQKIVELFRAIDELKRNVSEAELKIQDDERVKRVLNKKLEELRKIIKDKESENKELLQHNEIQVERIEELKVHAAKLNNDKHEMEQQALKEAQKQEKKIQKVRQEVLDQKNLCLEYLKQIEGLKKSIYEDARAVLLKAGNFNDKGVQVMPTLNSFAVQTDKTKALQQVTFTGSSVESSPMLDSKDLDHHLRKNKEQIKNAINDEFLNIKDAKTLLSNSLTLCEQQQALQKSHQTESNLDEEDDESIVVIDSHDSKVKKKKGKKQTMLNGARQDLFDKVVSTNEQKDSEEEEESDVLAEEEVKIIKVVKRPTVPKQIRGMISNAFLRREE